MSRKRKVKVKKSVIIGAAAVVVIAAAALLWFKLGNKPQPASSAVSASSSEKASSAGTQSSSAAAVSSGTSKASTSSAAIIHNFSLLMLVNKDNALPSSYQPNLTTIPQSYYYSSGKDNHFDSRAASSLKSMIDAGRKAGFDDLCILSGYRTYAYQQANYDRHVKENEAKGESVSQAKIDAAKIVAPPGTSEHETGLAADIITKSWYNKNGTLTADFDVTDAGKWLRANCAQYGFILRYPEDKVNITKYDYESWHFRFVGVDDAKKMTQNNQCLEEYVKK